MRINRIGFNYNNYIKPNFSARNTPPAEEENNPRLKRAFYPLYSLQKEEMSDEEFNKLKAEIADNCKTLEEEEDWDFSSIFTHNKLAKNNVKLAKKLLTNKEFPVCEIIPILSVTSPKDKTPASLRDAESRTTLAEQLCNDKSFPTQHIPRILKNTNTKTLPFAKSLCKAKDFPKSIIAEILHQISTSTFPHKPEETETLIKMFHQCSQKPQLYLTEAELEDGNHINTLTTYFCIAGENLLKLASLQDNALNDILFRKRLVGLTEYLGIIWNFNKEEMEILKSALKCKNDKDRALTPPEKVDLIDIINTYIMANESMYRVKNMVLCGEIDINTLKEELRYNVMNQCYGKDIFDMDIPDDKLELWDLKYSYLILRQLNKHQTSKIIDVIKLANKPEDFKEIILNPDNEYGRFNKRTQEEFEKHNLNYDKWLNPSKTNDVTIKGVDENTEQLKWLAGNFANNVNELLMSPAKNFINKKYGEYIKNNKLILPEKMIHSKILLSEFINNFIKELEPVWERAEKNLKTNSQQARTTLMIKDHIQSYACLTDEIKEPAGRKSINLTIKMWDRIPQHDLFQGNYSTCCIGMNHSNGEAMADYLTQTAFNMIELVDNDTNKTVGNALCYYVSTELGKPALVIDNIEINNTYMPSQNNCEKIRDGIKEYALNLNKEVGNGQEIPIYLGTQYNDVPCSNLNKIPLYPILIYPEEDISEITYKRTKLSDDCLYLDAFGGWSYDYDTRKREQQIYMYEL